MTDPQLSLLTIHQRRPLSEREKGREIVQKMGERNAVVLQTLRRHLGALYYRRLWQIRDEGKDERGETEAFVTADDAREYMADHPELRLSSNSALGALFQTSAWESLSEHRDYASKTEGSHANALYRWKPA